MSHATILGRREGPGAIVTLNRPERRNAISLHMMGEIAAAVRDAEGGPAVRMVSSIYRTAGKQEGICALREKRKPRFTGT